MVLASRALFVRAPRQRVVDLMVLPTLLWVSWKTCVRGLLALGCVVESTATQSTEPTLTRVAGVDGGWVGPYMYRFWTQASDLTKFLCRYYSSVPLIKI
jgi:hypothetical protein